MLFICKNACFISPQHHPTSPKDKVSLSQLSILIFTLLFGHNLFLGRHNFHKIKDIKTLNRSQKGLSTTKYNCPSRKQNLCLNLSFFQGPPSLLSACLLVLSAGSLQAEILPTPPEQISHQQIIITQANSSFSSKVFQTAHFKLHNTPSDTNGDVLIE
jgi:hypothetical protein